MPFERKDIALTPDWSWVIFGDGMEAQIVSMIPGKDTTGKDVWKMTLIPTKELAKKHNLTLDLLDENLTIKREYPIDMVKQLSSDPSWTRFFCFLNFNGELCPEIMTWSSFQDSKKIDGLRRLIDLLKAENAYLIEQLEKAKTNVAQFIKEYIMAPAAELNMASVMQSQLPSTTGFQPTSPVRQQ